MRSWAHYGHPDPHQSWVRTRRGALQIRRGIAPSWLQNGAAHPKMASGVVRGELKQRRQGWDGSAEGMKCRVVEAYC
jgi:hypothetical protein